MTDRDIIVKLIDEIVSALSVPVTPQEISDGWVEESKSIIKNSFIDFKEKLISGHKLPPVDFLRGMDYWGVNKGVLFKKVVNISFELIKLHETGSKH